MPKGGATRATSLGNLGGLHNAELLRVLGFCEAKDLLRVGLASWMMYALHWDETLWRRLVLLHHVDDDKLGHFTFHGSWKVTMLHPGRYPGRDWNQQVKVAPEGGLLVQSPGRPQWAAVTPTKTSRWYNTRLEPLMKWPMCLKGVDRRSKLTQQEFVEEYEKPNKPVVIAGAFEHWRARHRWTAAQICQHYGHCWVRTNGRSTNGRRFRMQLFDYLAYAETSNAEKYLYVFDKKIFDVEPDLLADFEVPEYFNEDLFALMDDDDRPDYRWLLIGPHGSGSPLHTDPHGTSAWNAVLQGCKRVTFYPPHVIPPGVDEELIHSDYYASDDVLEWYREVFPRLTPEEQPSEVLVMPGDLLFIPSGWWHQVLNIGLTVAVTQNVCSPQTFPRVAADINEYGSRSIRKDFKCALAESDEYSALAEAIRVKRR